MESCPRKDETLTVISVEKDSITVRRPNKVVFQARWEQTHKSQKAKPLEPKHYLLVTKESPTSVEVERVTKEGSRDGCKYMLYEYLLVSEQN